MSQRQRRKNKTDHQSACLCLARLISISMYLPHAKAAHSGFLDIISEPGCATRLGFVELSLRACWLVTLLRGFYTEG